MNTEWLVINRTIISRLFIALLSLLPVYLYAENIEQIQEVGEQKLLEAEQSQQRIDKIIDSAQKRLIKYRSLLKHIKGLKKYNEQLSIQISNQQRLIKKFDRSLTQVALIERQISPLLSKMVDSLNQFIEIDLPFYLEERRERMALLRDSLAAADIDIAEKFRQVIDAYKIENEYGRTIDSYQDIVLLDGSMQEVNILRIGRVTLICQTKDTNKTAFWDSDGQAWKILDNITYRNSIRHGIKMANKQETIILLTLPVKAPEPVQ